mgnify:CR=1 FL=1|jgi:dTDP-4-dehydrorhamnose 3,5-epimerase
MDQFKFIKTQLDGVFKIKRNPMLDSRGSFTRFFCASSFKEVGFLEEIRQVNYSISKNKGTIRGMHLQGHPCAEAKIVSCVKGRALDVIVDVRSDSPNFLCSYLTELSHDQQDAVYVPKGFAHGFQTLTDDCEVMYLSSTDYDKKSEYCINPFDPKLSIAWPIKTSEISDRDRNQPFLKDTFKGVTI